MYGSKRPNFERLISNNVDMRVELNLFVINRPMQSAVWHGKQCGKGHQSTFKVQIGISIPEQFSIYTNMRPWLSLLILTPFRVEQQIGSDQFEMTAEFYIAFGNCTHANLKSLDPDNLLWYI